MESGLDMIGDDLDDEDRRRGVDLLAVIKATARAAHDADEAERHSSRGSPVTRPVASLRRRRPLSAPRRRPPRCVARCATLQAGGQFD